MIADSLLAPQDEVIDFISESLNNRNITIHYSYMENRLIQEDFNSCGAFAIENLIRMMEGEAIGDNAGDIRAAHQQLLSTMRGVGDHDTEKNDVQTTKENNSTQKDNKKTISKEKDCEDPDNNKNGYNKEYPNGEGDDKKDVQYNYTTSIPKSFEIDIKKVKYTLTSGVNKESEGVDMMDIGMVDINKLSNDKDVQESYNREREGYIEESIYKVFPDDLVNEQFLGFELNTGFGKCTSYFPAEIKEGITDDYAAWNIHSY